MSQHELNRPELLAFATDEVLSKVSASIKRTNHARLAIQVNITTEDLDGSVKLQASLDDNTYIDVEGSNITATGADQNILYEAAEPCSVYYRVAVTRNSGTYSIKIISHLSDANS